MNKKILTFLVCVTLGVMLVGAIGYYSLFSVTLNINQPIEITGDLEQEANCEAGETCLGSEILIENEGNTKKTIIISDDNENPDITTSYISEIVLTEKTVDFGVEVWKIPEGANTVTVQYTLIDDEFNAEVIDGSLEGYELIYYADNPDRFNDVSTAISVSSISENLPYIDDENAEGGDYDYCSTEEYDTCHGAKLWYVPSTSI